MKLFLLLFGLLFPGECWRWWLSPFVVLLLITIIRAQKAECVSAAFALRSCLLRRTPCMKYSPSLLLFLFFCFSRHSSSFRDQKIYAKRAEKRLRLAFLSLCQAHLHSSLEFGIPEIYEIFNAAFDLLAKRTNLQCFVEQRVLRFCGWFSFFLHNFRDFFISCILILDYNLISLFIRITLLSFGFSHWKKRQKAKPRSESHLAGGILSMPMLSFN